MEVNTQTLPICNALIDLIFSGDVLLIILQHLPFAYRLRARLVSKKWWSIANICEWDITTIDINKCKGKVTKEGLLWLHECARLLSPENLRQTFLWVLGLMQTSEDISVIEWLRAKNPSQTKIPYSYTAHPNSNVDVIMWIITMTVAHGNRTITDVVNYHLINTKIQYKWDLEDFTKLKNRIHRPSIDYRAVALAQGSVELFVAGLPNAIGNVDIFIELLSQTVKVDNVDIIHELLIRAPVISMRLTKDKRWNLANCLIKIYSLGCTELTLLTHQRFSTLTRISYISKAIGLLKLHSMLLGSNGCIIIRQMLAVDSVTNLKKYVLTGMEIPWSWDWVDLAWYISIADISLGDVWISIDKLIPKGIANGSAKPLNIIGMSLWCDYRGLKSATTDNVNEALGTFIDVLIDYAVTKSDHGAAKYLLDLGACANMPINFQNIKDANEFRFWIDFYEDVCSDQSADMILYSPVEHLNIAVDLFTQAKNELINDSYIMYNILDVIHHGDLERVRWIHNTLGLGTVVVESHDLINNISVRQFVLKHAKIDNTFATREHHYPGW